MSHEQDLQKEAEKIANMFDSGNAQLVHKAAEALRQDLIDLQKQPWEQRHLLETINKFDHKGKGADIKVNFTGQSFEITPDIYNHMPVGANPSPVRGFRAEIGKNAQDDGILPQLTITGADARKNVIRPRH